VAREICSSYAMEERKKFIRDTVIAKGRVNRQDVVDKFKVTLATVAMDMRLTMIRWPSLMRYDRHAKTYMLLDRNAASEPDEALTPAPVDTFICDVRLKSGGFSSTIEFQLDGDVAAMNRFIEAWLHLMSSAIKLGVRDGA